MSRFKCAILLFIVLGCRGNENSHPNAEKAADSSDPIGTLVSGLRCSSLTAVAYQIASNDLDSYQKNRLKALAVGYSDTTSIRNSFLALLKKKFGGVKNEEVYLIEMESSGEVFSASNILIFSGESERGYRYDFENAQWVAKGIIDFSFSISLFFKELEYDRRCANGDYAAIDELAVTRVQSNTIDTKIITAVCTNKIPRELLKAF